MILDRLVRVLSFTLIIWARKVFAQSPYQALRG